MHPQIIKNNDVMKMLRFIFVFVVALSFAACEKEIDLGYPKTVTFSKDGGSQTITTANGNTFSLAEIHDYKSGDDGTFGTREDGTTEYNTYEWLTVEYQPHSTELRIIAKPNNSRSRTLHIELYSGPDYHVVKVTQEAAMMLE